MSGFNTNILQKLTRKSGIEIEQDDNGLTIELRVSVKTGENILDTCVQLQKLIIDEILELTGIMVNRVHIKIDHIQM